jgi:hypothetical protein
MIIKITITAKTVKSTSNNIKSKSVDTIKIKYFALETLNLMN